MQTASQKNIHLLSTDHDRMQVFHHHQLHFGIKGTIRLHDTNRYWASGIKMSFSHDNLLVLLGLLVDRVLDQVLQSSGVFLTVLRSLLFWKLIYKHQAHVGFSVLDQVQHFSTSSRVWIFVDLNVKPESPWCIWWLSIHSRVPLQKADAWICHRIY